MTPVKKTADKIEGFTFSRNGRTYWGVKVDGETLVRKARVFSSRGFKSEAAAIKAGQLWLETMLQWGLRK